MELFSWVVVIAIGLLAAYGLLRSVAPTVRSSSPCAGCPLAADGCEYCGKYPPDDAPCEFEGIAKLRKPSGDEK